MVTADAQPDSADFAKNHARKDAGGVGGITIAAVRSLADRPRGVEPDKGLGSMCIGLKLAPPGRGGRCRTRQAEAAGNGAAAGFRRGPEQ
jgi:hypothetical protein